MGLGFGVTCALFFFRDSIAGLFGPVGVFHYISFLAHFSCII